MPRGTTSASLVLGATAAYAALLQQPGSSSSSSIIGSGSRGQHRVSHHPRLCGAVPTTDELAQIIEDGLPGDAMDQQYTSAWMDDARRASEATWHAAASSSDGGRASLQQLREAASALLPEVKFPGRKDEAWRRCDLSSLASATLVAPVAAPAAELDALLASCLEDAHVGRRLVLVDGVIDEARSDLSALPAGVQVGGVGVPMGDEEGASEGAQRAVAVLASGFHEQGADPRTALGCYNFGVLNQASLAEVVSVHVPEGVHAGEPVHVIALSTAAAADADAVDAADSGAKGKRTLSVSNPSLVVSLGKGASLKLLQQYAGSAEGGYFTNAMTRVVLDEGAALEHSYLQEQGTGAVHIDSLVVRTAAGACYDNGLLASGGRISRINLGVYLDGPEASSNLRGLTLATGTQLSDVHSAVHHKSPDCESEQEQRNAIAGRARVVFHGGVHVPTGADNTTAAQLCRALLLSDDARVDIQPTLEIDTDDVSCTHGATVSDLDDEMIFYLQARGLSRLQARALLLEGWARDALQKVPSDGAKARAATKAAQLAPESERIVRRESLSSI